MARMAKQSYLYNVHTGLCRLDDHLGDHGGLHGQIPYRGAHGHPTIHEHHDFTYRLERQGAKRPLGWIFEIDNVGTTRQGNGGFTD